jgi:hypothetical protein
MTTPEKILDQLIFDDEGFGWAEGGLEQVVKWGHEAPKRGDVAEFAMVLGAVAVQFDEMGARDMARDVVEILEMLGPHLKRGAVEDNSDKREVIAAQVGKMFDTKQPSAAPRAKTQGGPNVKGKVKRGLS